MFKFSFIKHFKYFFLGLFSFLVSTNLLANNLVGVHTIIGIDHYPIKQQWLNLIKDYDISGVVFVSANYSNPKHVKESIKKIKQLNLNKAFLFCIDQEGGQVNRVKFNNFELKSAKFYSQKDSHYVAKQYYKNAKQLAKIGINVNFSPVVDVNRNTENEVIGSRSFSANPLITTKYAQIVINQQNKFNILSVLKHFPGHGQTTLDSHYELPVHSDLLSLETHDIFPFFKLIKNGAKSVMVSHVLYPSLDSRYPASLSKKIVTNILIKEMNFDGLIFSDDINMGAIKKSYGLKDAWLFSVKAGVDQVIVISSYTAIKRVLTELNKMLYRNKNLYDMLNTNSQQILSFKQNHIN